MDDAPKLCPRKCPGVLLSHCAPNPCPAKWLRCDSCRWFGLEDGRYIPPNVTVEQAKPKPAQP